MPLLVQFGAGAIGRSFVGQLFARAGWEVVFADISQPLIAELNRRGEYRVVIKRNQQADEILTIRGVRGMLVTDKPGIAELLGRADLAATSVGLKALPHVLPLLAAGLLERERLGAPPLDVILAENIHGAAELCRGLLAPQLPAGFALRERLGLIETSIGKMVPVMQPADLAADPLWLFAEEYNELILDRGGFLNPLPAVPGLKPVAPIHPWVDRKLYIHNLGHAAAAYHGFAARPQATLLAEALGAPGVRAAAEAAMRESAAALLRAYPDTFTAEDLEAHIQDLLTRFANLALGDTVYRVGSDLRRKLAREDRIVGPMRLCARHGVPFGAIAQAFRAALGFRPLDHHGQPHPADAALLDEFAAQGPAAVLHATAQLDPADTVDAQVLAAF